MEKRILALASVLALVAVLVMPSAVLAGTDTVITGTVPKTVEVSAPATFDMPSLSPLSSLAELTSGNHTATVNANSANWTLTVQETGGGVDGIMYSASGNLTSAMTVQGGDQTSYASLATLVGLETGTNSAAGAGQTITDIYFRQAVSWADVPANYTITVVFTITAG